MIPNAIKAKDDNEVSLMVTGQTITLWEDLELTRSFNSIADKFTFSAPWDPTSTKARRLFKPFSYYEAAVYIGGKRVFTGTLMTHRPALGPNKKTITIEGYSKPGILADCPLSPKSWPFNPSGLTLQQIADKVCQPYNITVKFEASPGSAFNNADKVDLNPDQKCYEFLSKLAIQRGLIMSSSEYGELVFLKTTSKPAIESITGGVWPYLGSSVTYNGQKRFSEINALGTKMKGGYGEKHTVHDPELEGNGVYRPCTWKAQDTAPGQLKTAATSYWGRMISSSIDINVEVDGWRLPREKSLWKDNIKINYKCPADMVYDTTEMLTREATLRRNNNSMETRLKLTFPEAYDGKTRGRFPWG
ncbi:MAG: hypothetical protein KA369_08295 [Spirochaetes bacterium]|nr:hypothetical protein [Spirochaetota bacterium]